MHHKSQACNALQTIRTLYFSPTTPPATRPLPLTSPDRLLSSSKTTILYLAYGSNLSSETFLGRRGIHPISSINIHCPSLDLTFDLPGIPYIEPCFANTRPHATRPSSPYHKDRWVKGLIGVVYEVTPEDYRTIIATEGGGASYQDVLVSCYPLGRGDRYVDPHPSGESFKAHTLLAPHDEKDKDGAKWGQRPDGSYAQASARYLKLITDGAEEHSLPAEYMDYLYGLLPYTITTVSQRVGQGLFLATWGPLIMSMISLAKLFADEEGKTPEWIQILTGLIFGASWASYDLVFKKAFGDGERTIGDESNGGEEFEKLRWWSEKSVRLEDGK